MRIATLNLGSATLKAAVAESGEGGVSVTARRTSSLESCLGRDDELEDAVRRVFEEAGVDPDEVDAVGHRVVHGGSEFREPTPVDRGVEEALHRLSRLAPLHNPPALAGIRAARDVFPGRPMVAVFDTAFHAGRPRASTTYPVPGELSERLGLVRYGFHGIAHESLVESLARERGVEPSEVTAVTLQLGGGCSACAVREGRSVETSMGLTPLEGLVMPARAGDVGPGALLRLVEEVGDTTEVEEILSCESGMTGLAGSPDVRVLLRREERGDDDAALALEVFVRRIVQTVGGYLTLLDGEGAIVFGGGIGTNSAEIRRRIARGLAAWGVDLDPERNADPGPGRISRAGARGVHVYETDEESLIARKTANALAMAS